MKVSHNDIITFYTISWNDGWNYGNPNIILSPIVEFTYDAGSIEAAIDELCLELCTNEVEDETSVHEEDWRGWDIQKFKDFVINSFENKPCTIPKYFIEYFQGLKEDYEDSSENVTDKDLWGIIGLDISKFVVKFTLVDENEEDWYEYEILSQKTKYIENE